MIELSSAPDSGALNLAYPLDTFYQASERPVPHIEQIPGSEMPEPYRRLLVGAHDMTPTLEAFYGERVGIRLLDRRIDGDRYRRLVVLTLADGSPVEFGAIIIYLNRLPSAGRASVLAGATPFGTVLANYSIVHESRPRAFLKVEPDDFMREALRTASLPFLFGRRNELLTADRQVIADILEILPPADEA